MLYIISAPEGKIVWYVYMFVNCLDFIFPEPKAQCSSPDVTRAIYTTVSQEPQCARFRLTLTVQLLLKYV